MVFKNNFYIDAVLIFYFVFIFWNIRIYSYDRSVKLNAGMEAEEEAFEEKFFYFGCEPLRAKKIKKF